MSVGWARRQSDLPPVYWFGICLLTNTRLGCLHSTSQTGDAITVLPPLPHACRWLPFVEPYCE